MKQMGIIKHNISQTDNLDIIVFLDKHATIRNKHCSNNYYPCTIRQTPTNHQRLKRYWLPLPAAKSALG